MRGPDWKWGHQDNGKSVGTVTEPSTVAGIINSSSSEKWCNVIWDEGGTNIYRVGFKFDLCVSRTGGSSNSSIVAFIVTQKLIWSILSSGSSRGQDSSQPDVNCDSSLSNCKNGTWHYKCYQPVTPPKSSALSKFCVLTTPVLVTPQFHHQASPDPYCVWFTKGSTTSISNP